VQPVISFLTDFGLADTYVGQCKGVIASISPRAQVLDITHAVPPYDIASGAYLLSEAVPAFPICVHVAVIDPGVGTARRPVAVETARGDVLVGPDNGLLLWAAQALGGVAGAVELADPRFRRQPVAATFHARDIFCPVAAHIVHGVSVHLLGPTIAVESLVPTPDAEAFVEQGVLHTRVVHIDHYGTLILAARAALLADTGNSSNLQVRCGGQVIVVPVVQTFADVPPGEPMLLPASSGHLSLACNRASFAARLGIGTMDRPAVALRPGGA
jgi:S-adenosylmethionine hydrolase